jgi:hypothetical protein
LLPGKLASAGAASRHASAAKAKAKAYLMQ